MISAGGTEWTLVQATPTAEKGETYQSVKIKERGRTAKKVIGNVIFSEIGDKEFLFRYVCLPDTVDPRVPKGTK